MADWLTYANQGAVRNQPLDPRLVEALGSFVPQLGLGVEVFSGGQDATGPNRVGSHRHDRGQAGDVFFTRGGQRLNWANSADLPIFEELVRRARSAGVTGIGAGPGYMQEGSMHVGFGSPAAWGAGGRSRNAPAWLRNAYYGADAPQTAVASNASPAPVPASGAPAPIDEAGGPEEAPQLPPPYDVADRPIFDLGRDQMASAMVAANEEKKPTLGKALGKGLDSMGKAYGSARPVYSRAQTPQAARVDAPEMPPINQQLAEAQRQQLAAALARLNSGSLV
jgi:hypothetical protein